MVGGQDPCSSPKFVLKIFFSNFIIDWVNLICLFDVSLIRLIWKLSDVIRLCDLGFVNWAT